MIYKYNHKENTPKERLAILKKIESIYNINFNLETIIIEDSTLGFD